MNRTEQTTDIKQDLINELNKRVEDKILEQSNADLLIKLIKNADDSAEALAIAALGTTYKRTGLHFDKRLEKMTNDIHYFKKNEKLSFHTDDTKPVNKLIIGDNFQALQNLLIQYKGKINVIYIDPPYGKDSMGEFAKTNYNNSLTRDNLLSMLYPRLHLAKQLLSDDGVIFCSIDDKNQAYVKCLFDEVFGDGNFEGQLVIQTATDNNPGKINTEHEYMICFSKNSTVNSEKWSRKSDAAELIKNQYQVLKDKNLSISDIQLELRSWIKKNRDNLPQVAHYNNVDEKGVYSSSGNSSNPHPGGYMFDIKHPITQENCPKPANGWRWSEETFKMYEKNGEVEWGINHNTQPHIKKRIETASEQLRSIIYEDARASTKELENILHRGIFSNPKSVQLLSRIFDFATKSNSIILDFFAGSGTTGQAVLDLNKKDGGNRTFILCQMNEVTDTTPNGIAYDVTSKRLKRVMTGSCYDGTNDFEWLKKNEPYGGNLDVYEIASVANFETTQGKTPFDVIDETLYGKEKFSSVQEKIDWVCSNFEKTQKVVK